MAKKILEVQDMHKKYGKKEVVKGVSFSIEENQIFGLLGPNGAGKTTTFSMIVGVEKPTQGRIIFEGNGDITAVPMFRRAQMGINYLPQESSIFRKLSVENNIRAIVELQKLSPKEENKQVEELLDFLHITHIRDSYGYSLSGGERRRVEIARALASNPRLLLLDEPFAGIDPVTVHDIQKIIQQLVENFELAIIITDHNVRETLRITDYAAILVDGTIFAKGTPEMVVQNQDVREVYLGSGFEL